MSALTPAQEEFNQILSKASSSAPLSHHHPSDIEDYRHDRETDNQDEEAQHLEKMINKSMKKTKLDRGFSLPHRDFDKGRTTGVKGVIADARSYAEARQHGNLKVLEMNQAEHQSSHARNFYDDGEDSEMEDGEFIERWRQQRHAELQNGGHSIKNRRTSPSARRFGRFDDVDALGYLDAIEKVTQETVVVVFVYDSECPVTQAIAEALTPLAPAHPFVHFVRVHYSDIEFDNAGVPAILAYKNQGNLFANLTYVIDYLPEDTIPDTRTLEDLLRRHNVLNSSS
ncbi:hypothetical protein K3495_g10465 [Podosphaera aphanis]|nr:hypothetical protein K3495_g10465 [Podosphaera aphanis]